MSDKDLGQSLENMEEGIENLKNKEFRVFGIKVTFMTVSALVAVIGSVIGTLYGGFLMYQKVEQAIAFVEQQTEYEEKIAGFDQRMALIEGKLEEAVGYTNEIRGDLKGDIRRLEGVVDDVERSSKQLQDAQFYASKDIYRGQRNVDNARVLRGLGTDRLHQEMVNQQYNQGAR